MKPSRKQPVVVVVRPITDAQKAKEAAAQIKCGANDNLEIALRRFFGVAPKHPKHDVKLLD
jgi:hypothetical protein